MKTTVELPDALFEQATRTADQRHTTLEDMLIKGLEREVSIRPSPEPVQLTVEQSRYFTLDSHGIPVLKHRDGPMVTNELVNKLREELGV